MIQQEVFLVSEGDRWFDRNAAALHGQPDEERVRKDVPLRLLCSVDVRVRSAIELGCSSGWRLDLMRKLGIAAEVQGTDASGAAIAEGRRRFPDVGLRHQPITTPLGEDANLVVVNFVLHWLDRPLLPTAIATIDATVRQGGYLLIGDFLPDAPLVAPYKHYPDMFTYKLDYAACFLALGFYKEVARLVFDHDDHEHPVGDAAEYRRAACTLMRKDLKAMRAA